MFRRSTLLRNALVLFVVLGLAACSGTPDRKAYYKKKGPEGLEVPPDLVLPEGDRALDIPSIGSNQKSYSELQSGNEKNSGQVLTSSNANAHLVREGDLQWLEIKAPADQLWKELVAFFRNEGFEFTETDKRMGYMETNWQDNHVGKLALGDNWFSNLLGRLISDGVKDKYRMRMEKIDEEKLRLFISHQGLREKATQGAIGDVVQVYWEQSEPDPELEAEMLQRFLVFRGMGEDHAREVMVTHKSIDRAEIKEENGQRYLEVNENFARSWRRMGITLDRMGILVEDRNRSEGIFYIKVTKEYWEGLRHKDEGFFDRLFGKDDREEQQYLLKMRAVGEKTQVAMFDQQGKLATDQASADLITQFQRYLR